MTKIEILPGSRFGMLTVLEELPQRPKWIRVFLMQCECGNTTERTRSDLMSGKGKSCGCLLHTFCLKHGHASTINRRRTSEYRTWIGMKQRCLNPNGLRYADYGGRGITIYPAWINDFEAFLQHIGPRPSKNHSLDRINNNGNYEPGNVRWATRSEQQLNRRKT